MSETTALLLIHSPSGYDPLVGRVQEQLRKAQGEYEAALIRAPYARSAFLVVPASLTLTFIAAATFILLAVRPSGGSVVLSYLATALVPVLVQSVILVLFVAWCPWPARRSLRACTMRTAATIRRLPHKARRSKSRSSRSQC